MKFSVGVAYEWEYEENILQNTENPRLLSGNLEDLTEYAKCSKNPIIILDESFRVIHKNRYVNKIAPKLARGEKIFRFLPEDAKFEIEKMKERQILRTEFSKDEFRCYSAVISIGGYYVIVLDYIGAELASAVGTSLERMSGYDIELNIPIGKKGICSFNFAASENLLTEAINLYKTSQPIPFFNSAEILKCLVGQLEKQENDIYEKVNLRISGTEYISSGSERDFVLAIACTAAFCLAASCDERVDIEIVGENGFTHIRVRANTDLPNEELLKFLCLKCEKEIKNEEMGWIYLLKILSDLNLWEFSTNGSLDGKIGFSLRMAVSEDFKEFALSDIETEYLANIIALVFAKNPVV